MSLVIFLLPERKLRLRRWEEGKCYWRLWGRKEGMIEGRWNESMVKYELKKVMRGQEQLKGWDDIKKCGRMKNERKKGDDGTGGGG